MQLLNTFLSLVSQTNGRDKFLRLIQYATLYSTENKDSQVSLNVYNQIRNTRKVLRFLRTLQYSTKIRKQIPQLIAKRQLLRQFLKYAFSIFQNLFTILFFLSDHRVLLADLKVIDKSYRDLHYPKSYKFYMLQNVFGVLRNIMQILIIFIDGKYQDQRLDHKTMNVLIKRKFIDLIRCLLDIFVALHYLNKKISAKSAGILGVITSIIAIMQTLVLF